MGAALYMSAVGKRFGRLIVTGIAGYDGTKRLLDCQCDCGSFIQVRAESLRSGNSKSCGCYRRDRTIETHTTHGAKAAHLPEYFVWKTMHQRCGNPRNAKFKDYGARGIVVCDRWHSFANFIADMGRRPSDRHSIDRTNNDGPYAPGNCRWATASEQARNKRNTRHGR